MIVYALIISIVLLVAVLAPFFFGKGGELAPASSEISSDKLVTMKTLILEQYLAEEKHAKDGAIGKSAWAKRQIFLTNRYVDFGKQLDHLKYLEK